MRYVFVMKEFLEYIFFGCFMLCTTLFGNMQASWYDIDELFV